MVGEAVVVNVVDIGDAAEVVDLQDACRLPKSAPFTLSPRERADVTLAREAELPEAAVYRKVPGKSPPERDRERTVRRQGRAPKPQRRKRWRGAGEDGGIYHLDAGIANFRLPFPASLIVDSARPNPFGSPDLSQGRRAWQKNEQAGGRPHGAACHRGRILHTRTSCFLRWKWRRLSVAGISAPVSASTTRNPVGNPNAASSTERATSSSASA